MNGMDNFNPQPQGIPRPTFELVPENDNGDMFDVETILIPENKITVTDFFGDNRETWYKELLNFKSPLGGRVSLDSQEQYDIDLSDDREADLPPLNPESITPNRAKQISSFFKQHPGAQAAFLDYLETDRKSKEQATLE